LVALPVAAASSQLDPDLLDDIVDEVVLPEVDPDGLDRLSRWFNDLQKDLIDWLKSITGGEGGWLDRLGDWVKSVLSNLPGVDPVDSLLVMKVISWLSVAIILGVLAYALFWLWRAYRPLAEVADNTLFERMREQAAIPLTKLPSAQQPAAIFYQVCLRLAERGSLDISPERTNQMLARCANLPAQEMRTLGELANAADRALFGGWQPHAEDISQLLASRAQLLSHSKASA